MNIGKNILELRKQKNIKQEEVAAELGVTAAAVSKWENGYTLPDILMLCALADYFQVTTDELLGRTVKWKYAVIATDSQDLGEAIKMLIRSYGFIAKKIYSSISEARDAAVIDSSISHLFASFSRPLPEEEHGDGPEGLRFIEVHSDTHQKVLDGFEIYFRNMSAIDSLRDHQLK